jgi:DNA-binding transcriptional ArsR family regulator
MDALGMSLVEEPARLRAALTPLRRQLLERLQQPASATQLATELGLPRQRLNYHLRALERAGLLELVEERARRGCTERIMRATATAYFVDPGVMTADESAAFTGIQDRYAAEHLVAAAAGTVRDVVRMQAAAEQSGTRLLTFTIEADVRFGQPGDVHDFTDALAAAFADTAARFDTASGRAYRVVIGGHPAPRPTGDTTEPERPSH